MEQRGPVRLKTQLLLLISLLVLQGTKVKAEVDEAVQSDKDASRARVAEEASSNSGSVRQEEIESLSAIRITADPFTPSLAEYASPATVVEKKDILRQGETTIGETLRNQPGVSSTYFGPGASRPVIRGNAGERVRVLKNGVGSFDVSNTSEDHAISSNPLTAESVEILRGPETLLFGTSAIGGVVNVTDNSLPETEIGSPVTGALDYRQGTADDELSGAIKLEGQVNKFNWHLDYFHQDTNDIDIPGLAESEALRAQEEAEGEDHEETISDGKLLSSATRSQGFTAGGSYIWKKGFIGISVKGWKSNYGVPGHAHPEGEGHGHSHGHDDEEDEHHDDDEHHDEGEHEDEHHEEHEDEHHDDDEHHGEHSREELHEHDEDEHHEDEIVFADEDHDHEDEHEDEHDHEEEDGHGDDEEAGVAINAKQLRVDVRGQIRDVSSAIESIRFRLGASTYEHEEVEGDFVGTKFDKDAGEGRIELSHTPLGSLEGVLGFQIQASDFSAIGEEAFLPEVSTLSPSVFVFEELPISETFKLQAGARYDYVNHDAEGFSTGEFHPIGFSTGFVYDPTGTADYTLGLSAAYTQRAPAATELYANGAHVARQIFEVGDESLEEERSYGLDLTAKKNTGLLTGEVNLFIQDYDDYVNLAATGEESEGLPVFRYDAVDALFWGFEVQGTLHLHEALGLWAHDLDLLGQVDYVRARNTSDSEDLPRIPPLRTIVGFEYGYKDFFTADVEGVFAAKQNETPDFELPTDAYQLLNAGVRFNLPVAESKELSVYVRGSNLTDEEARVHSSFLKDLAPLRGRSLLFGVRGVF